jgi:hypothetical protein
MREYLKPTQKDIIDANNRASLHNMEVFRQSLREYLLAGGELTFNWSGRKRRHKEATEE